MEPREAEMNEWSQTQGWVRSEDTGYDLFALYVCDAKSGWSGGLANVQEKLKWLHQSHHNF